MDIHKTNKAGVVEDVSGIKITDQFRWLEDFGDPEVKKWVQDQNKIVSSSLKDDSFDKFSD